MVPDKFYHPLSSKNGQNIDDALRNGKNLVATICQPDGIGHAVTLYKKEQNYYVYKNSDQKSTEDKILANQLPYRCPREIWKYLK